MHHHLSYDTYELVGFALDYQIADTSIVIQKLMVVLIHRVYSICKVCVFLLRHANWPLNKSLGILCCHTKARFSIEPKIGITLSNVLNMNWILKDYIDGLRNIERLLSLKSNWIEGKKRQLTLLSLTLRCLSNAKLYKKAKLFSWNA